MSSDHCQTCRAAGAITRRKSPVFILSTEASRAHRVCGDIQLLMKATRGVSPERNTAITVPVSGLFAATESQRLINRINQNGFRSAPGQGCRSPGPRPTTSPVQYDIPSKETNSRLNDAADVVGREAVSTGAAPRHSRACRDSCRASCHARSFSNCLVVSRRIDQPCRDLRSSRSAYSMSPVPARACRSAARVSALGTFTANGNP